MKEGEQYANTRYYLANRFSKEFVDGGNAPAQEMQASSGLVGGANREQIPDILTGEIWKGNQKNGDRKMKPEDGGETGYGEERVATKVNSKVNPQVLNPYSTTTIVKPEVSKFDEAQYKKQVLPNEKGEHRDILFGHGLNIDEFHRNQLGTTYDLSFNQSIKPQTQVNSFYNVDPTMSAKKFHHETVYLYLMKGS